MKTYLTCGAFALATTLTACAPKNKTAQNQNFTKKLVVEAQIADLQNAIKMGKTTCLDVVNAYIERIETYDQPKTLNAITYKNYENARAQAKKFDEDIAQNRDLPTLFCVPMLVKDNMDVKGIPTTAGSKMLMDNFPPDTAKVVSDLENQGAIVLAKTNMAEWAFSPRMTKSTSAGVTKNAYNLDYVPAGSSGGAASGVAANFALVGLGTDTGNSVRGPSSHLSLVGMRSTHGRIDLDGIVPLVLSADVVGPMTRTVADNAKMLSVMAGTDYTKALRKDGLKGKRIGVLRGLADPDDMDSDVGDLFENAIADLKKAGAEIVDPATIPNLKEHVDAPWGCLSFRKDVHEYLTQPGMHAKISDPYEAYEAGVYSPYTKGAWGWFKDGETDVARKKDGTICGDLSKDEMRQNIKADVLAAMKAQNLDAFIYPSWRYPAARLDRANEDYKGDNSQTLAPPTGLPALTVPMGFAANDLPVGLQFLGRDNSEKSLYEMGYAYEQATIHRRPPHGFGPVRD